MDAEVRIELTHPFEDELFSLVTTPHCHAQRGIEQEKEKFLEHMRGELAMEDPGTRNPLLASYEATFEDRHRAQRESTLVTLVTRLSHALTRLGQQAFGSKFNRSNGPVKQLRLLTEKFGPGPVGLNYFEELVTVRDSIIHADSLAEWEFPAGNVRRVGDRYIYGDAPATADLGIAGLNTLVINITEEQLNEAVDKCVATVKWFDEKINPLA